MTASQGDMFGSGDGVAEFVAALPCLRCFVQLGIIWRDGVKAIETPWGLAPSCVKHASAAPNEFSWKKLNVSIADAAADIAAAAGSAEARVIARKIFDRERNRALGRPLYAPVIIETPTKGESSGRAS